jgi:hypothetical protein
MQAHFGNGVGQFRPVILGNHGQHHIDSRLASGAGKVSAPHDIDLLQRFDVKEFAKGGLIFPVNSRCIAAQQARACQSIGTRANRPKAAPVPRVFAQPGQCLAVSRMCRIGARADDDSRVPTDGLQALIRLDPDPGRAFGGCAVQTYNTPAV